MAPATLACLDAIIAVLGLLPGPGPQAQEVSPMNAPIRWLPRFRMAACPVGPANAHLEAMVGKRTNSHGAANDHPHRRAAARPGCARWGADLALTYLNAKAEPCVRPLVERLGADLCRCSDPRRGTRRARMRVRDHRRALAPIS
jgi:hypothetical protein